MSGDWTGTIGLYCGIISGIISVLFWLAFKADKKWFSDEKDPESENKTPNLFSIFSIVFLFFAFLAFLFICYILYQLGFNGGSLGNE